jgi:hypothetical protein
MKQDPIIREIRAVRKEIEEECGGTAEGYARHLHGIEKQFASRLVRYPPRPVAGGMGHVAEQEQRYGQTGTERKRT